MAALLSDSGSSRPSPVIRTIAIPLMGADMVSELTIRVDRQFHSSISTRSASRPVFSLLQSFVRRDTTKAIGSSFAFASNTYKNFLVKPLHSLAQCTQGIEAAIQLMAREPREVQQSVVYSHLTVTEQGTANRTHSPRNRWHSPLPSGGHFHSTCQLPLAEEKSLGFRLSSPTARNHQVVGSTHAQDWIPNESILILKELIGPFECWSG